MPLIGDLDGDTKSDLIVWRPGVATWFWLLSSSNYDYSGQGGKVWGDASLGDVPLIGDVDGDNMSDLLIWRASTATWWSRTNASGFLFGMSLQVGASGDRPLTSVGPVHRVSAAPAPPTLSPAAGTYSSPTTVGLSTATPGTDILYTVDGSAPSLLSTVFDAADPIVVSAPARIRAISHTNGYENGPTLSAEVSADYTFPAVPPVIVTAAGAYPGPVTVQITVPDGSIVRLTRDGSTPTESSEVYPAGGLQISVNTTLVARAFRLGWAASTTVSANYTVAAAAPTIVTAAGQYETPVTVAISAPMGSTVRLTRDGTTPTASSEQYLGPFEIAQNTQLRAVSFTSGTAPSAPASADYTFAAATPTFNLQGGTYAGSISVTIASATAGASLYWTDDGTDPTMASNSYSGPIVVSAGVTKTIRARAFRTGWASSSMAVGDYTTDLAGLVTISARVSPQPNSVGWNNSDVTVSFSCTNATVCPPDVVVSQETNGQTVSGTATNADHSATASVYVKLDKTPPTIALTSPTHGDTTSNATVTVSGATSDSLSGLAVIRCNGVPATNAPSVSCVVDLSRGRNSLVLSAMDAAGNSNSSGAQVTRTGSVNAIAISPPLRTMMVGQSQPIRVTDGYGTTLMEASVNSSDTNVLTVVDGRLSAVAPGVAVLSAAWGALSKSITLTVLAPSSTGGMPPGAISWTLQPTSSDAVIGGTLMSNRVADDVPDMFVGEHDNATGANVVHGLAADGTIRWTEASPTDWRYYGVGFADAFGGLVGLTGLAPGGPVGLARFAGPAGAPPWRYETGATSIGNLAQARDGTIFAAEARVHDGIEEYQVVGIDGADGRLKFRIPLMNSGVIQRPGEPARASDVNMSPIAIGSDGSAYVQWAVYSDTQQYVSAPGEMFPILTRTVDGTVRLLKITTSGAASWTDLEHHLYEGPYTDYPGAAWTGINIADPSGDILATSSETFNGQQQQLHMTRLAGGEHSRISLGSEERELYLTGDSDVVLLWGEHSASALTTTGQELWHTAVESPSVFPLATTPGGGALEYDMRDATLLHVDGNGQIEWTQPIGLSSVLHFSDDAVVGIDDNGALNRVAIPLQRNTTTAPSPTGQGGAAAATIVTYAPEEQIGTTSTPYSADEFEASLLRELRENPTKPLADATFRAAATMRKVGAARLYSFFEDVGNIVEPYTASRRVDAVGFIGHSVYDEDLNTTVRFSVGLKFFDRDLIKQNDGCIPMPPYDPTAGCFQWVNKQRDEPLHRVAVAAEYATWIPRVFVSARVLFVASCYLSEPFKALWDITDSAQDRVLIVPVDGTTTVDLRFAAEAWIAFSGELSRPTGTLASALAKANAACPTCLRRTTFIQIGGRSAKPFKLR